MMLREIKAAYTDRWHPDIQLKNRKVIHSGNIFTILKSLYERDGDVNFIERFYTIMLNRANKVIGWNLVSKGGVSTTVADPKVIFSVALTCGASSIILAHNHPSGNLKPSEADISLTRKIKESGLMHVT
jgi:DNA repair protein RadC